MRYLKPGLHRHDVVKTKTSFPYFRSSLRHLHFKVYNSSLATLFFRNHQSTLTILMKITAYFWEFIREFIVIIISASMRPIAELWT